MNKSSLSVAHGLFILAVGFIVISTVFIFLTSGDDTGAKVNTHLNVPTPAPAAPNQSRFVINRVGVIDDDLAYESRRGIYTIIDTQTGKEFVGVSGIGISETGSHMAGKIGVSDER